MPNSCYINYTAVEIVSAQISYPSAFKGKTVIIPTIEDIKMFLIFRLIVILIQM